MKILGLIIVIFIPWSVLAETVVVKEVLGVGPTKNEAVTDGLLEAIQQVKGVEIKTDRNLRVDLSSIVGKDGSAVTSLTESTSSQAFNRAFGWVKTYELIDVKDPAGDVKNWQVKLKVSVPVYESLMPDDKRKTLAVLPFTVTSQSVKLSDARYSPNAVSNQLSDAINALFVQSNQFAILNRDFGHQMQSERDLWASPDVPSREASRLGQKLGADLVLLGKVYKFDIVDEMKEFYGSQAVLKNVDADLRFQIVEAATEKVLWSNKIAYQDEIKVNKFDKHERNYTAEVLDLISKRIVKDVSGHFFPLKVLDKEGTHLILNQGGENVQVGDLYFVYDQGNSITNPDTGFVIDVPGQRKGLIEIVQVNSNYSLAIMTEGDINTVGISSLVIPVTEVTQSPEVVPPRETPGSSDKPFNWK